MQQPAAAGRVRSSWQRRAYIRVWLRALLEEGDALIDVPRVAVDGRRQDAGEVVRQEAAGSVVVAVGGAVAAALYVLPRACDVLVAPPPKMF